MIAGVLLAAGGGRRMGLPKALLRDADGVPLVHRAVDAVRHGGCDAVIAVLGAGAAEAAPHIAGVAELVVADDWESGMGASLRAGLRACADRGADAALITLVDLPDVDAHVVGRVLDAVRVEPPQQALARATYGGSPGHPVVIGRQHWAQAARLSSGDQGARALFATHPHQRVECGDLASGRDADTPGEFAAALADA